MTQAPTLSVIIPANNEAGYIGPCLHALANQILDGLAPQQAEVIVAANACTDATLTETEAARGALEQVGWRVQVIDIATPGKLNAMNTAEATATGRVLVYLDADVICEPAMMAALVAELDTDAPLYASGHLVVAPSQSWVTRRFAKTWQNLPFMTTNVQGAGLFATNRRGRARWAQFPDIIADDGFVRLMFAPHERIKVNAIYHWPMVDGFKRLVQVRRRQDAGVRELTQEFPDLLKNESKPPMGLRDHLSLFIKMPVSYMIYVAVMLAVKRKSASASNWTRGR